MSKETLEKARDIVANKWHQGSYTDYEGGYCALAALGMANSGFCYAYSIEDVDLLAAHLKDVGWKCDDPIHVLLGTGGEECNCIPHFNDHSSTTKELVLQLFDKAIANL